MGFFDTVEARSPLDRHRILSKKAAVRVSPLCLGAMSLGMAWSETPAMSGGIDESGAFELLDTFFQAGGNFIDSSVNYQDGQSDKIVGKWSQARGNRDQLVIASKFGSLFRYQSDGQTHITSNFAGNSEKNLRLGLAETLKNLQTDYLDILYVHWYDWSASIEEMMLSLDEVVRLGKVLYLGASDMPAWVVSAANTYARANGLNQFVVYQGMWNAAVRDFERDILPMARHEGMAIAPWAAVGRGRFRTAEQIAEREKHKPLRGGQGQSEAERKMSKALQSMGEQELQGASITQVALAYLLAKYPYCFPIVGGTKVSHLQDNIKAVALKLNDDQLARIEEASSFDPGFPMSIIKEDPHLSGTTQNTYLIGSSAVIDWVTVEKGLNRSEK